MRPIWPLLALALAGCAALPAQPSPTPAPPTRPPAAATAPGGVVVRPTGGAAAPGATAGPAEAPTGAAATALPAASLPPGWSAVAWEGLAVPLPPGTRWDGATAHSLDLEGVAVLAAGRVEYGPPVAGAVEAPQGPYLFILGFAGSPADWLDYQEAREPLGVDRASVAEVTLAGGPGLRYQPVVTGTCNAAYYVRPLDGGRLLWLWVDCLGEARDDELVRLLRLEGSPAGVLAAAVALGAALPDGLAGAG